jgi:hypothetical protein
LRIAEGALGSTEVNNWLDPAFRFATTWKRATIGIARGLQTAIRDHFSVGNGILRSEAEGQILMALFSACFVFLFVAPCALYFFGFLAKLLTAGLRDPSLRRRVPMVLRSWDETLGPPAE